MFVILSSPDLALVSPLFHFHLDKCVSSEGPFSSHIRVFFVLIVVGFFLFLFFADQEFLSLISFLFYFILFYLHISFD